MPFEGTWLLSCRSVVHAVALVAVVLVPVSWVAVCGASVSRAAEEAKPQLPALASADAVAAAMFQRTAATGMVIVVVRGGDVWMQSYGQTAPGSGQKPAFNSLIRLCSISKILTTDLLVKLAVDHAVAFTDPLQKFAPVGSDGVPVKVPVLTVRGHVDRALTLGDLATHTAGLPREIAYPPVGMAHFTFPDEAFRWQWLPKFRLRTSPGVAAHYSNVGFDLLGDALSHVSGRSYAALFAERTARPLGLVDTTLSPNADQCARLMGGAREPIQCTDTQAAAGSGGMYSTADDMTRVLKYLLNLPGVPAHQNGAATAMYLQPAALHSVQGLGHAGVPTGIGLGWIEINGADGPARIVQKTGGGAGFQTYVALNPASHTGVFVAATQGRRKSGANLFRETNALLIQLAGLPPVPVDPDDPERERGADEGVEEAGTRADAPRLRGLPTTREVRPLHHRGRAIVPRRAEANVPRGRVASSPKVRAVKKGAKRGQPAKAVTPVTRPRRRR